MAYTNRKGKLARFKTGYLQIATILHQAKVTGGTDESIHNAATKGFLVGRVVVATKGADGIYTLTAPSNTDTEAGILTGNAYIIAQSDNSMRGTPDDAIHTENYDTRYDGIVKNTDEPKAVAVYKIVNTDDIEFVEL